MLIKIVLLGKGNGQTVKYNVHFFRLNNLMYFNSMLYLLLVLTIVIASKRQNTHNVFDKMFEMGMCKCVYTKIFERSVRTDGQFSLTKVHKIRSVMCLALICDYYVHLYLSPCSIYIRLSAWLSPSLAGTLHYIVE